MRQRQKAGLFCKTQFHNISFSAGLLQIIPVMILLTQISDDEAMIPGIASIIVFVLLAMPKCYHLFTQKPADPVSSFDEEARNQLSPEARAELSAAVAKAEQSIREAAEAGKILPFQDYLPGEVEDDLTPIREPHPWEVTATQPPSPEHPNEPLSPLWRRETSPFIEDTLAVDANHDQEGSKTDFKAIL